MRFPRCHTLEVNGKRPSLPPSLVLRPKNKICSSIPAHQNNCLFSPEGELYHGRDRKEFTGRPLLLLPQSFWTGPRDAESVRPVFARHCPCQGRNMSSDRQNIFAESTNPRKVVCSDRSREESAAVPVCATISGLVLQ